MSARGYLRGFSERGIGFDLGSQTFFLEKPSCEAEAFLDKRYPRTEDGTRWLNVKRSLVEKGIDVVKSVTSGFASPEVLARRKLSCFGDASTEACDALVERQGGFYCGACGCGAWMLAKLDGETAPKLGWKKLNCPKGRPGFSNEVRA